MELQAFLKKQGKRWSAVLDILSCLYFYSIKKRVYSYCLLIFTGVLSKIASLAIFVVVIQAVVALVLPEKFTSVLQKLGPSASTEFISENLDAFAYGLIVVIQLVSSMLTLINQYLWNNLSTAMLAQKFIETGSWRLSDDAFMIEHLTSASQALVKALVALSYMFVLILMLAVFSFALVILLLPLLIIVIFLQLAAMRSEIDKSNLVSQRKSEWAKSYRIVNKNASAENLSSYFHNRFRLLDIKRDVEHKAVLNSVWLSVLGSALTLIVVYSITKMPDMDITLLTGYLIFFVFAVRGIVASLREVSVSFNKILNLRKYRINILSLRKNLCRN